MGEAFCTICSGGQCKKISLFINTLYLLVTLYFFLNKPYGQVFIKLDNLI